jgi:serine O-acetyltransferase
VVREDFGVHGRDWTNPGFRALTVQRLGAWRRELPSPAARWAVGFVYRWGFRKVRNLYGIELPGAATIGRRVRFLHQGGVVIHSRATIGDDCVIRHNVTIGAATLHAGDSAPVLGARVQVGVGAVVVGGVTIGDDVRIGPNAVVTRDVPAGATVITDAARMIQLTPARRSGGPLVGR